MQKPKRHSIGEDVHRPQFREEKGKQREERTKGKERAVTRGEGEGKQQTSETLQGRPQGRELKAVEEHTLGGMVPGTVTASHLRWPWMRSMKDVAVSNTLQGFLGPMSTRTQNTPQGSLRIPSSRYVTAWVCSYS